MQLEQMEDELGDEMQAKLDMETAQLQAGRGRAPMPPRNLKAAPLYHPVSSRRALRSSLSAQLLLPGALLLGWWTLARSDR